MTPQVWGVVLVSHKELGVYISADGVAGEIGSESRHEFKFTSKQGLEASDTGKGKAAGKKRSYTSQWGSAQSDCCAW